LEFAVEDGQEWIDWVLFLHSETELVIGKQRSVKGRALHERRGRSWRRRGRAELDEGLEVFAELLVERRGCDEAEVDGGLEQLELILGDRDVGLEGVSALNRCDCVMTVVEYCCRECEGEHADREQNFLIDFVAEAKRAKGIERGIRAMIGDLEREHH
jgi:hypothetical protein